MQLGSLIFNSKNDFTFQWTADAGAASYRFRLIDEFGNFGEPRIVTGVTHTETIKDNNFYGWQVEALDAAGNVISSERSPLIWLGDDGKEWYEISAASPNLICMAMTQDSGDDSAPLNYYLASPDKYTRPIVSFRSSDQWPVFAINDNLLLMDGELYVKNGNRYIFYGSLMQGENISPRLSADSSGFFSLNSTVYRYSGGRAAELFALPDTGSRPEIYFLNSQVAVTDSGVWRISGAEPELAGVFDFPLPDASELTISGKYAVSYGNDRDSMISYRIDSRGNVSRLPDVSLSLPPGYQASEIDLQENRVALLASDWEGGNLLSVYEISGDSWRRIYARDISGFDLTLFWKDSSTIMLHDQAEGRLSSIKLPADSGAVPVEPDTIGGLDTRVNKYSVTVKWNKSSVRNCMYELRIDGMGSVTTKSNKFTFRNVSVGEYSGSVRVIASDGTAGEWSEPYTVAVTDVTAPKLGKVTAAVDGYTGMISWSGSDNVGVEYYEVRCAGQVKTVTGISAHFENLAVGKYSVEVTAYDAAGNASKTGKAKITVRDATPPEQVTGLAVPSVDGRYKATLSWTPGMDNSGKVSKYEIQLDNGKILKSGKTFVNVSKLSAGEHSYRVRAIDKEKNVGEWSEVQAFTVKDMTAPKNVSVKAKVGGNSLLLSWKTPKDNVGVTGYILKHGVNLEHTEFLAADELAFRIDGIAKGSYQYQLMAVDAAGNESKPENGKAMIKTELPMAEFSQEVPDMAQLTGFDSGMQTTPGLMDDPLAFCSSLKLDAGLKLSAVELSTPDETGRRSAPLFTIA